MTCTVQFFYIASHESSVHLFILFHITSPLPLLRCFEFLSCVNYFQISIIPGLFHSFMNAGQMLNQHGFFFLLHVIAQPGCDVPRTAHMFPICKQNTMLQTQSQLKCAVTVIWERLSSNYRSNRSACHQGDTKRIWCWHCLLSICTSVTMCFYLYSSVWKTKKQLLNSGGDLFS